MSKKTQIEWTEFTWNPTSGCTKVSQGCKNCYAEVMANRLKSMGALGYENGFELTLHAERLEQPITRKKPTIYFVNSMSDLFHENIPVEYIDRVFNVIQKTPYHIYQILTKRPENMMMYFSKRLVPSNVWLGVSVEDRKHGMPRIDILRDIKANIRFLSIEPLLEDIGKINIRDIHWVIVGGESGHNARQMKREWVENIQTECLQGGVAFFFKQWGMWGEDGIKRSKQQNGRSLNGKVWDDMPFEFNSKQLNLL